MTIRVICNGIRDELKDKNTKDEKEQRYIQTCPCGHLY
jgi:hypothetical protein